MIRQIQPKFFICDAADGKPGLSWNDFGAQLYHEDTNNRFHWNGTEWEQLNTASGTSLANQSDSGVTDVEAAIHDLYASAGGGGVISGLVADDPSAALANTTLINAALSLGGSQRVETPGVIYLDKSKTVTRASTLTYDVCLVIPSNTRIYVGSGVTLKAKDGLSNVALIQNSDVAGGNASITISGPGIWDGNSANTTRTDFGTTDFACIAMWFQKITNLVLDGVTLSNPQAWGIGVANCTRVRATNTKFKYTAAVTANQGGFQFQGANSGLVIRDTYGNPYDDLVAIVCADYGIYTAAMAGPGAAQDILIDGVQSDAASGCWHHVRILDATAYPCQRVQIRNVSGPYHDAAVVMQPSAGNTGALDHVLIDGVDTYVQFGKNPGAATISLGGTIHNLTIRNVHRRYLDARESTLRGTIHFRAGIFTNVVVDGLIVKDEKATGSGASFISIAAGITVTNLTLSNVVAQATYASGSGDSILFIGGTVGRATISNVTALNINNIYNQSGTVTDAVTLSGIVSSANQAVAFTKTGNTTLPVLALNNVVLAGTQGGASGCISFNGLSGTCLLQIANSNLANGANAVLVRAGSESIRAQSMCTPLNSAILTPARGDIILDSANSNDPYRYNGSTWSAL